MQAHKAKTTIVLLTLLVSSTLSEKQKATSVPGYASITIDPMRVQLLGIATEKITKRDLVKEIRTVGIVEVDETRREVVQTKFSGWIEKLYANFVGMPVKKGDPLFAVYSPDLYSSQEKYLIALKDVEHPVKGQFSEEYNASSKMLLNAARKRLVLWDISQPQIQRLHETKKPMKRLEILSPLNGIVLSKKAFIGMNVAPGMNMYMIADLSEVWVLADIYEDDINYVKLGQSARLRISSQPGKVFNGKVTFIDYVLDPATRTTKVRFIVENKQYLIKPGMYAQVEISIPMGKFLALPEEALIDTGKRKIVFISKGKGQYEPREIQLGFKAGAYYQILSGLSASDEVVTSAQFLLDSESRMRALERKPDVSHG